MIRIPPANALLREAARDGSLEEAHEPAVTTGEQERTSKSADAARIPRLVFVNRYFFPDVSATSQMLSDLARRLAEHGSEVHIVCSRQLYDDPSARLPASESVHGIQVHRVWTSRFGRDNLLGRAADYGSFYCTSALKLLHLLRRHDVVVAKTDPPLISIVAALVANLRGAHLVNWLQDIFPEVASHLGANPLPRWLDEALQHLRDRFLRTARVNVVLGARMREYLLQRKIDGDRIQVIENWADGDAVVPKAVEQSNLRQAQGIAGKFVVAYSGNLGRAHEFATLLAAAGQLRLNEQVVFLMIGGGVKMQQLHSAVAGMELPNFIFLPYQPRATLSDALAAADVHLACLLPQLEGLIVPSKFYGILAAGRPTIFIGHPDGELARIIRDSRCGSTVAVGDADALVGAILHLAAQKSIRDDMGARARTLFMEQYTVARATQQWIGTLARVGKSSPLAGDEQP